MAKKKELYTLSKDGEVIKGTVVKQVNNKTMLDLGDLEALIIRDDCDVFQTEQEAINEQNDIWFDSIVDTFDVINEDVSSVKKELKLHLILLDKLVERVQELESKKWYEFWK